MISKKIGNRIREIRATLGETQEGIAFKSGIDRTFFNRVERGYDNISVDTLNKVLKAMDVSWSTFFDSVQFKH